MVSTDTPAGTIQYPVTAGMVHLVLKPGSRYWGLYIRREYENYVNVGSVSFWDVKEDDKHIGSDYPQCQYRKIGLA